ncbi:ADP-ribose pyrophosphatase [Sulfurimicrobium lacus]|uniref:ADP-ribose pyrophosphatase n=1 Tax=Sulfurimicrobium lacus TaxID=2715678 RepID=A0A6F8VBC3_9PROT|nr:bifunctional nicotinamide-nucleotide adenylyltransferase/Nudix hydroxylase [Sulfurimicrobium lacus]BCB26630.1 ADP-ribose pyrophosphatase [Sulfurimicrobium lacus]
MNEILEAVVYVGRFEPLHNGHFATAKEALACGRRVVIVIGSADRPRTPKNPFTTEERIAMWQAAIRANLGDNALSRFDFLPMRDFFDDARWAAALERQVTELAGRNGIGLIGHFKDATSYYLKLFKSWQLIEMGDQAGLSSTAIRKAWYEGADDLDTGWMPRPLQEMMADLRKQPWFEGIRDEYAKVEQEKARWGKTPYPLQHVTADAVVRCNGKVLLIRRKGIPGRGLLALPGGFVDPRERAEAASLRELAEETNIVLPPEYLKSRLKDKELFDHPDRSSRGRTFSMAYFYDLEMIDCPAVRAGDDAGEAMWVPVSSLDARRAEMFEDHFEILERFVGDEMHT